MTDKDECVENQKSAEWHQDMPCGQVKQKCVRCKAASEEGGIDCVEREWPYAPVLTSEQLKYILYPPLEKVTDHFHFRYENETLEIFINSHLRFLKKSLVSQIKDYYFSFLHYW